MAKKQDPKKELAQQLRDSHSRWQHLLEFGGQDPFYEDAQEEDETRMRKQKQASEYIGTVKDRKLYASGKSYTLDELVEELETLARIIC